LESLPPAFRRGAARDLARAVLRSRLRVRGDAAESPAAPSPDARRRIADAVPTAGRMVGLDLHHMDDQLVRSRLGTRTAGAAGGDGIEPPDGRRHPRGLRRLTPLFACAYVVLQVVRNMFNVYATPRENDFHIVFRR